MSDETVPAAVRLVRDFVNTREPQAGTESLTGPADLRAWLSGRDLLPAGAELTGADLATALAVREGLRAVLLDHAGEAADPAAVDALDRALASVPVRLAFGGPAATEGSGPRLVAAGDGPAERALAGLVDAVRRSAEDGSWPRLKVCARDTCRWAFYDASRNQARRWCSMAGCGNHVKMRRAYAVRTGQVTRDGSRG